MSDDGQTIVMGSAEFEEEVRFLLADVATHAAVPLIDKFGEDSDEVDMLTTAMAKVVAAGTDLVMRAAFNVTPNTEDEDDK